MRAAAVELGFLLIDDGLRREVALGELKAAAVLQLRVERRGLGGGDVRLRLIHQRLELHFLDLIQKIAGLDLLALAEQDFFKKPFDPGADIHRVDGLDMPDELEGLADAFQRRRAHADRRHGRRRRLGLGGVIA